MRIDSGLALEYESWTIFAESSERQAVLLRRTPLCRHFNDSATERNGRGLADDCSADEPRLLLRVVCIHYSEVGHADADFYILREVPYGL